MVRHNLTVLGTVMFLVVSCASTRTQAPLLLTQLAEGASYGVREMLPRNISASLPRDFFRVFYLLYSILGDLRAYQKFLYCFQCVWGQFLMYMPLKTVCSDDILPASICEYYFILVLSALTSQTAGFPLQTARASEHGKTFTAYSKHSRCCTSW